MRTKLSSVFGAALLAAVGDVNAIEALGQARQMLGWDTGTVVAHGQPRLAEAGSAARGSATALPPATSGRRSVVERNQRWQDWGVLVLGGWPIFGPFFMAYASATGAAAWNSYIAGALAAIFAASALWSPTSKVEEWVNLVLGAWMVVAPFVYDCLQARIAERTGFDAVYMTGFGTAAARTAAAQDPAEANITRAAPGS